MTDIEIKAVLTREDGSKLYREEHGFYNLTPDQADAISLALDTHLLYLRQLEKDQKKKPSEVLTAVFSATGEDDVVFTGFTFDTFEKALRSWGKVGDDLVKALEKSL